MGDRGYHTAAFISVLLTLIAMPLLVGDKFVPWRESGVTLKEAVRQSGALDFVSFRFEVSYGNGPMTAPAR